MVWQFLVSLETPFIYAVGFGLVRNIFGWLENSLRDGKIQKYEWKKLGKTMVEYFIGIYFLSQGMPIPTAIAGTFGLDFVEHLIKISKKE